MKKIKKSISLLLTFVMLFSVLTSLSIVSVSAVTHLGCVKQNDAQWKNYYYGTGNLYDTGCGIFSLVNAVGYLTGQRMSVTDAASWAHSINAFNVTDSEGTYRTVLYPNVEEKYGADYGFTVDCGTGTGYWEGSYSTTLKNHLANGGVAIGHVPGHFIALVGYDSGENKFHVYDSYAADLRGTNRNGGDVWVTQSHLATDQLCLDWFCLLSLTGGSNGPGSVSVGCSTGIYTTSNYLSMHSSASASGSIVTIIPSNAVISVTKVFGGWGYTFYNNKSGYVRLSYTTRVGDLPSSPLYTVGVYKTTSDLNMRGSASASGSIVTIIPSGTSISVTSISGNWGYVLYNSKSGYIHLGYTIRTGDLPYTTGVYQTKGDLNMRDTASASGNILATLPSGTVVSVTKISDDWGYISYNGKSGYINLSYAVRTGDLPKETPYPVGVYETTSDINVRTAGSASGALVGTIPSGTTIFVISVSNVGWGYTSYTGLDGYINLKYAKYIGDLPASANCITGFYTVKTDINMRSASAYESSSVTIIPANTTFSVTKISGGWGYTAYKDYTGWVNLAYATYIGPLTSFDEMTKDVKKLEVTKLPDRKFVAGTEYELKSCLYGMEIKVTYTDDTDKTYTCESYDSFSSIFHFSAECIEHGCFFIPALEENVITISYGGKSAEFCLTGLAVETIELVHAPERNQFIIGHEYDIHDYLNGMEIKVTYSDGENRLYGCKNDIELFRYELEFSGECFDETTDYMVPSEGENIVTLTYAGKSTSFTLKGISDLGDANFDGEINIKDATVIQRYLANLETLSDKALKAADFDGSGQITISDVTEIQKFIAEID